MNDFIIRRSLSVSDLTPKTITLTIYKPKEEPGSDWVCSFQIEGIEKEPIHQNAYGLDALQALLNALEGARLTLLSSNLSITWDGGNEGDIGIPRMIPMSYNSDFVNDIDAYIDRKIGDFSKENKIK